MLRFLTSLFARSATATCQKFPAHWGGDCYGTYEFIAETLRGGLSLALSGFAFWSNDIGGFENTAPADIYKRWVAFGLLSSHSRLHGSKSYRVPWNYDDEACDVLRFFTKLKCSLMPYLYRKAVEAHEIGLPMMRPVVLEYNQDKATYYLETQYLLGDSIMVAPVFSEDGSVDLYLPQGKWTSLIDNHVEDLSAGGSYRYEVHNFLSLPLYVRENTLLAIGENNTRPDYEYNHGTTFHLFELQDNCTAQSEVTNLKGEIAFKVVVRREGNKLYFTTYGVGENLKVVLRNIHNLEGVSFEDTKLGASFDLKDGLVITLA